MNIRSCPYSCLVATLDTNRSWIVIATERRTSAEFEGVKDFLAWAKAEWPPNRYRVDLDPGQLALLFDRGR